MSKARENAAAESVEADRSTSCIVGIGASAGGLEAFEQFFAHLPPDTGFVFVLVPHLEPTHKGMMPELLSRRTKMPVVEAEDGMMVEPNCVYVIPPNAELSILHGKLQVLEPVAARGMRTPIDFFLRHLAADQKENAVAIILSGMGSDGTLGLKAIKEHSGLVMVQDPVSAQYDSMPRSAINTGMADCIAAAQDLPAKLTQCIKRAPLARDEHHLSEGDSTSSLEKIFVLLRVHTGNDFSCYKMNTINRRIERRLSVHQFNRLPHYVRYLQENPQEVELLYKELLIGVTNFFRDPGLFDALKELAIPKLLQDRPNGNPLRVWNPACSTGEETYSLAILLKEYCEIGDRVGAPSIQIFATDIDKDAIDKARRGAYPSGIAAEVRPERLDRFFLQDDDGYRIKKEIRDLAIFAPQNILVDSPFTRVDIVCCRNFLIYVNAETQQKLMPLLHYALSPGGLLILGTAETIGNFDHLFTCLDKRWKIYQRREVLERPRITMPASMAPRNHVESIEREKHTEPNMDITYAAQRLLLDSYGPPSVVVNADGDILYLNGRTGKYLEPASGKVNNNVFAMAREGLREPLGAAMAKVSTQRTAIFMSGIKVKSDGSFTTIKLTVRPLSDLPSLRGALLVVFEDLANAESEATTESTLSTGPSLEPSQLEDELRLTRERLQAVNEDIEATQEELRSANEELQSNNEELQSTNEELNSSKEEMQSINEEMQTVNTELQAKIEDLSQSNSDMKNLLNGIEIATIFLDNNLSIARFTPHATRIVNLVASDVGRPFSDFATKLKHDDLIHDAKSVLETLLRKETQVEADDGRWYNIRILPYRTASNAIDGVVMTFADMTAMKRLEESLRREKAELQAARNYAENIVATIREPLVVLDGDLRIVSASAAFYKTFQVTPDVTERHLLYEIGQRQWNTSPLRKLLADILLKNTEIEGFRVEQDFPVIGRKVFLLNARQIEPETGPARLFLLAMEDITAASAKN